MGKAAKALKAFIMDIPDSTLAALPTLGGTIHSDDNFRLDMQGMTTAGEHNLQVSISTSTLKMVSPATVAGPVLVPNENPWCAAEIREMLLASLVL
ncbi:hypothetical protein B0T18DRAFT_427932 [Schizothecium vesticola]|uniref:Uncharacterized protein n=1 Tax=Schizothecium vesticola TaxID=314040 RepID=A0AA40K8G7_9PEZI|nr:hypothetical protein B0T18DRAFT_427932 [Schizothecium vesticola]